jgi:hypothetical protein
LIDSIFLEISFVVNHLKKIKSFVTKKLDMELEDIFGFFMEGCFSSSFKGPFISSIFLKIKII